MADRSGKRLGQSGEGIVRPHRHFEDDPGELHRLGFGRTGPDSGRALHQQGRQIMPADRGAVHPGREARVHFEQPALVGGVAHHLELAAAGPVELLDDPPELLFEGGIDRADVAGPGLALGGDVALAHGDAGEKLAPIGGEHDRFLIAADMGLEEKLLGRPDLGESGPGGDEAVPARHPGRVVIGLSEAESPFRRSAAPALWAGAAMRQADCN